MEISVAGTGPPEENKTGTAMVPTIIPISRKESDVWNVAHTVSNHDFTTGVGSVCADQLAAELPANILAISGEFFPGARLLTSRG